MKKKNKNQQYEDKKMTNKKQYAFNNLNNNHII